VGPRGEESPLSKFDEAHSPAACPPQLLVRRLCTTSNLRLRLPVRQQHQPDSFGDDRCPTFVADLRCYGAQLRNALHSEHQLERLERAFGRESFVIETACGAQGDPTSQTRYPDHASMAVELACPMSP
jgi:hypothetical protein